MHIIRRGIALVVGTAVTIASPLALAAVVQPCRHRQLSSLLFWSAMASAVLFHLAYQVTFERPLSSAIGRSSLLASVLAIFLLWWLPSVFGAYGRARQARCRALLRQIGAELDQRLLGLPVARRLGPRDAWGTPVLVATRPGAYVVVSFGECGVPEIVDPWGYTPGATSHWDDDLVFSNGQFIRVPEGPQE